MKKIPTGIACALLLCATGVTAQVPRVLGIWEFNPQASLNILRLKQAAGSLSAADVLQVDRWLQQ